MAFASFFLNISVTYNWYKPFLSLSEKLIVTTAVAEKRRKVCCTIKVRYFM